MQNVKNKLTQTQQRAINVACEINQLSARDANTITFFPTDFLFTSFPYARQHFSTYSHTVANKTLTLNSDPDFGLPYGSMVRLILAYLTKEACTKKTRTLSLPRISQFCKTLNSSATGNRILAIRNQALALFTTQILIKTESQFQNRIQGKNFTIIENYSLWSLKTKNHSDWVSEIYLSEAFYNQAIHTSLPIDYRALRQLARAPIAMDLFMWLTYRLHAVENPITVRWASLKIQFGQGYADDKHGRYRFKKMFTEYLQIVHAIYSDANIELADDGLVLKRSRPHVPK